MNQTGRIFLVIGGVLGASGIILGAMGAHSLKTATDPVLFENFLTGTRYQMIHTLLLVGLGIMLHKWPNSLWLKLAGWATLGGIICFSGSLYGMAWFPVKLGAITPIGGILFIVGWLLMAINFLKKTS